MRKLLVLLVILGASHSVFAEDPVLFADANLKAAVEAELGISDPTPTDMLGLTVLNAKFSSIVDLTGIESAINLTSLGLYRNNISNVSSLTGLTNLTSLILSSNQISDISSLAGLKNLTSLIIHNNHINDISILAGLKNLTDLNLGSNQISDISSLVDLTNLTWLQLLNNPLNCPSYDIYIPQIEANNPGIALQYSQRPDDCDDQPDIDVSPLYYDFPNTGVVSANGVIVTISNMGNVDLTINSLDLNPDNNDFYILYPPILPFTIAPQNSSEIEIIFEPLTVGPSASTLAIGCDDIDEPFVGVELSGFGIVPYYTISEQIVNILDFIDTSVEDGSLVGKGPGKSGKNRLKPFIKMVETVQKHIDSDNYKPAGNKIDVILKRCSGGSSGFVGGEAVEELVELLLQLRGSLKRGDCENIAVIDEAHVFNMSGSLRFLLDQRNVDASTIIVWDSTRTKFYIEGADYTVGQIDNQTEIRIQPAGEIFSDGDQILRIDYDYNTCDWPIPEIPDVVESQDSS